MLRLKVEQRGLNGGKYLKECYVLKLTVRDITSYRRVITFKGCYVLKGDILGMLRLETEDKEYYVLSKTGKQLN